MVFVLWSLVRGPWFLLLALILFPLVPRAQSSQVEHGIGFSFQRSLAGPSWYSTPGAIGDEIERLGYPAEVERDLHLMADLWRHEVNANSIQLVYRRALSWKGTALELGGTYRWETGERYAEVMYDPAYIFSGVDMRSRGGGLHAGLNYRRQWSSWLAYATAAIGYYNFSRDYLHYFYLDPVVVGPPIEKRFSHREFHSGPGGRIDVGFGYSWKELSGGLSGHILSRGSGSSQAGDTGIGIFLMYSFYSGGE
jgi:hypothetical protein